eukprot:TRINITY_DN6767_c0_g1_i1.p1 TRINITY_DN6767_c0_g1~~TRINITY_DN6767_c0_g1_i1.p1  ORF type:complete len:644 (-),score=139.09 TRINITY_DN6767_c0_g1_i1:62-1993(-)
MADFVDHYRTNYLGKEHYNFICEKETENGEPVLLAFISILEVPAPAEISGVFPGGTNLSVLVTNESGQHTWSLSSKVIKHSRSENLGARLEAYLNAEAPPELSYYQVTDPNFPIELAKLEDKHPRKITKLKVGVVYASESENIKDLAAAPPPSETSDFWSFLKKIGYEINTANWTKYLGDMKKEGEDAANNTYFTETGDVQVMYHIAPWLTTEQYRRLIGNDVLIIVFYENKNNVPFKEEFCEHLGKMPQIFAVVSPKGEDEYTILFFQKTNIASFAPFSPPLEMKLCGAEMRELLLARFYNGYHEAFKVAPLKNLYTRPREQTMIDIASKFPRSLQVKARKGRLRGDTSSVHRQKSSEENLVVSEDPEETSWAGKGYEPPATANLFYIYFNSGPDGFEKKTLTYSSTQNLETLIMRECAKRDLDFASARTYIEENGSGKKLANISITLASVPKRFVVVKTVLLVPPPKATPITTTTPVCQTVSASVIPSALSRVSSSSSSGGVVRSSSTPSVNLITSSATVNLLRGSHGDMPGTKSESSEKTHEKSETLTDTEDEDKSEKSPAKFKRGETPGNLSDRSEGTDVMSSSSGVSPVGSPPTSPETEVSRRQKFASEKSKSGRRKSVGVKSNKNGKIKKTEDSTKL